MTNKFLLEEEKNVDLCDLPQKERGLFLSLDPPNAIEICIKIMSTYLTNFIKQKLPLCPGFIAGFVEHINSLLHRKNKF